METLDSGIGSRSPTPDCIKSNLTPSHVNSSKEEAKVVDDAGSTTTVTPAKVNGSSNSSSSSNNTKTFYNNNNRHSAGHGQYKKYHQSHHCGYGGNMYYQHHRYNNGHRQYQNSNTSTTYHHHNNHHYQGQSYHHHRHNTHSNNNSNNKSNSQQSQHHPHMNQSFNPHSRGSTPQQTTQSQVFVSSGGGGGENATNSNWSSPSLGLEAVENTLSTATVPISINLEYYSPAISPTTTTDSNDGYSLLEDSGNGTITVTTNNTSMDVVHYAATPVAATTTNFSYPPFPYHPAGGIYTFTGPYNPILTGGGGGRNFPYQNHHQLITQGLLMSADSPFPTGKADSSINCNGSEKTLEWSDDGLLYNTVACNADRGEEFPASSGTVFADRSLTPEYIYTPFTFTSAHHLPQGNNKKRSYGTGYMSGKMSPVLQNHRYPYPRKVYGNGLPREWFEDLDPEEYVKAFGKFGEVTGRPTAFVQDPHQCDSLSEGIWQKFLANQQTTETFRKKMELWRDVNRILRNLNSNYNFKHDPRNFPAFGLQVVGSTMSGFGSNTSDVDMCLLVRGSDVDQRYEAVDKLQVLYSALRNTPWLDNVELIYAKVPILKFRDPMRCLEVDLNCNNYVGIRNTHLLYCYSQADWRLKPLVLIVKLWAHFHGINDAKNMTISSYSLVLMVIHFLQCGVEEPVLPVLHQMYKDKFKCDSNILGVKINEHLPSWQSKNKDTLGSLLTNFLLYYADKFDYSEHTVSARTGGTIPTKECQQFKSSKNDPHQWKYLCIEEPFDRTNTARSVYDRDTFDRIIGIFNVSYHRLRVSRNLESIFTQISETDVRNMAATVR